MTLLEEAIAAYIANPCEITLEVWNRELGKASPSMRRKTGGTYALRRHRAKVARDRRGKAEA